MRKRMRVLSLFSGLGAFEMGLTNEGVEYDLVNYCEKDKYVSKAYSVIHGEEETKNLGDILKVEERGVGDCDILFWGFPCTSISQAGKQAGILKGETASGLYYEGKRILAAKLPKYSIIENVKALTTKRFKEEYKMILRDLEDLGYENHTYVLNAKNYGVPQNRERLFIVSILGGGELEIKGCKECETPRLKEILEEQVDEKMYLKRDCGVEKTRENCERGELRSVGQASTKGSQAGKVYSKEGLFPTCCAGTHGYAMGYIYDGLGCRKITPKEAFRLMGIKDTVYEKVAALGYSDTQMYKMAGNSIVVPVVEDIIRGLLRGEDKKDGKEGIR